MLKYTFQYNPWKSATVTVTATSYRKAIEKAREELDRRYESRDIEPPVAWGLEPIRIRTPVPKTTKGE